MLGWPAVTTWVPPIPVPAGLARYLPVWVVQDSFDRACIPWSSLRIFSPQTPVLCPTAPAATSSRSKSARGLSYSGVVRNLKLFLFQPALPAADQWCRPLPASFPGPPLALPSSPRHRSPARRSPIPGAMINNPVSINAQTRQNRAPTPTHRPSVTRATTSGLPASAAFWSLRGSEPTCLPRTSFTHRPCGYGPPAFLAVDSRVKRAARTRTGSVRTHAPYDQCAAIILQPNPASVPAHHPRNVHNPLT